MARVKHPSFKRLNYGFIKRVKRGWRKPRGIDSKQRMKQVAYGAIPNIGYAGPRAGRHAHPCGLKESLVANEKEVARLDSKSRVARIRSTVGEKKRIKIRAKAKELKVKVLN
ncbi:TPA: 50S ribosomal protein L32e [Candidatus Micrarchaeota archaeon]|nr:MAG: hypothetical protein AUJ65_03160 [Candidatus Micrarchaeota archaeon CG1_02_51_15]HII39139.1 50S ribosomal protein L32e [Candidatus Micrarchaeota archaeon]